MLDVRSVSSVYGYIYSFFDRILIVTIPATSASRQLFGTIDQSSTKNKTKTKKDIPHGCKEGKEAYSQRSFTRGFVYNSSIIDTFVFFYTFFILRDILAKPIGGFVFLFWLAIKCNCADIYVVFFDVYKFLFGLYRVLVTQSSVFTSWISPSFLFIWIKNLDILVWFKFVNLLFLQFWVCYLFGGKEYK